MRFEIPRGTWAGGAFTTALGRDFSSYNALTFRAKSSIPTILNTMGLGNDNTGTSLYGAAIENVPLITDWRKVVIPIPRPSALTDERGMLFFAEGAEGPQGHTLWIDEVKFERVNNISNPRPVIETKRYEAFSGAVIELGSGVVTFKVGNQDAVVGCEPSYFTFTSTNPEVATVRNNLLLVNDAGEATITATLDTVAAEGVITVSVTEPPHVAAPSPIHDPAEVISLFSDSYDDVAVSTWSANWDIADVSDLSIDGDAAKAYTNLTFAGIELAETIDIRSMNYLHMDVWIPAGSYFKIKLVDFGEDGTYSGAPDNEHEITLTADTTPALSFGQWASLEIPMEDFLYLITREHLAQIIISGDGKTTYIDNLYFHP